MPLQRNSSVPLYQQLKELLLEEIERVGVHAQIPTELDLSRRHGVSRGTLQRALNDLVREGRLYRVQGKGTFVAPPRILRSFSRLPSYSEDIRSRGLSPGAAHVRLTVEEPEPEIRRALRLAPGTRVWQARRVQTASGDPVALVVSYLPRQLLATLTEADIARSLYGTIERELGVRPSWAHDTYRAENAGPAVAALLDAAPGTALLVSERLAYLPGDRPIEFVRSFIRGDRFEIHVEINNHRGGDAG